MKKLVILSLLAFVTIQSNAQNKEQDKEQLIEKRIERLTQKMQLADDKKEAFAKTYREYCKAMVETMPKRDTTACKMRQGGQTELTEEQAKQCIEKRLERQQQKIERTQKRLNIQKKYSKEFQKVLTAKQTMQVMKVCNNKGWKKNHMHKGQRPQCGNCPMQHHQYKQMHKGHGGQHMQGKHHMRKGQGGRPMHQKQAKSPVQK